MPVKESRVSKTKFVAGTTFSSSLITLMRRSSLTKGWEI
ncbi:unnamed protein product [Linum tenue]|uniref:Uncharacterized protein n=1 Tax=Linum tenue TaxID=586396 RepID=A0AAV0LK46_9ROSI|nr:unnamed protein product [Linum tenue]